MQKPAAVPSTGTHSSVQTHSRFSEARRRVEATDPAVEVTFRGVPPDDAVVQALRTRARQGSEPANARWRMVVECYEGTVEAWLECNLADRTVMGHGLGDTAHEAAMHALRRFAPERCGTSLGVQMSSAHGRLRDAN